jgi:hypothetical protein
MGHVGDLPAEMLMRYGVTQVFGQPGGQTAALYDGIATRAPRLRHTPPPLGSLVDFIPGQTDDVQPARPRLGQAPKRDRRLLARLSTRRIAMRS